MNQATCGAKVYNVISEIFKFITFTPTFILTYIRIIMHCITCELIARENCNSVIEPNEIIPKIYYYTLGVLFPG